MLLRLTEKNRVDKVSLALSDAGVVHNRIFGSRLSILEVEIYAEMLYDLVISIGEVPV